MVELKLVPKEPLPKGTQTTASALMPHVLCCIHGKGATVYRNRAIIREFKKPVNGILKLKKLYDKERKQALTFYTEITKAGPLLIKNIKPISIYKKLHDAEIGFEGMV